MRRRTVIALPPKSCGWRDQLACKACNWVLWHVASDKYRKVVGGLIVLGVQKAEADVAASKEQ